MTIALDADARVAHDGRMTRSGEAPRKLSRDQERRLRACDAAAFAALRNQRRERLIELREQGWTLPELGALLGCSRQRVHLLIHAEPKPSERD